MEACSIICYTYTLFLLFLIIRWNVIIKPYGGLGLRNLNQTFYMYNYSSVGVDTQVTLNFHRTRESRFYFYSNRLFNKVLYFSLPFMIY